MARTIRGVVLLLSTTILWGSSFIFIKLIVSNISEFSYTFYRVLISVIILTPLMILRIFTRKIDVKGFRYGIITGIAYILGLILQGAGTRYTTPSVSAFITGLNSIHVHVYSGLIKKSYSLSLFVSLILAILGLYMVTKPAGGFGFGELLIFLGSIAWAAQIIFISRYVKEGVRYIDFLYGMLLPSLLLAPYVLTLEHKTNLGMQIFLYLAYLAIACTLTASALQIIGQKYVDPATAAIIYVLEPLFALTFSVTFYGEKVEVIRITGGMLMVLASYIAIKEEVKQEERR